MNRAMDVVSSNKLYEVIIDREGGDQNSQEVSLRVLLERCKPIDR